MSAPAREGDGGRADASAGSRAGGGTDARELAIRALRRDRPRSRFARFSALAAIGLIAFSWMHGGFGFGEMLSARRLRNFERFLEEASPPSGAGAAGFYAELFAERGWHAMTTTLAISVAAIVLAAAGAGALALLAARNVAEPEPFLPGPAPARRVAAGVWAALAGATRAFLIFLRAVPEYVWAFLLLTMLGLGPWPAVLALALHNAGILGRLGAEVVENVEPAVPRALRGLGAGRAQIAVAGLFPLALNRFLLYFFYRWETCVREATILGLLGIQSLGLWILQARGANRYDEMVFYVALGAVLVIAGDVVSALARSLLRRSA